MIWNKGIPKNTGRYLVNAISAPHNPVIMSFLADHIDNFEGGVFTTLTAVDIERGCDYELEKLREVGSSNCWLKKSYGYDGEWWWVPCDNGIVTHWTELPCAPKN